MKYPCRAMTLSDIDHAPRQSQTPLCLTIPHTLANTVFFCEPSTSASISRAPAPASPGTSTSKTISLYGTRRVLVMSLWPKKSVGKMRIGR